MAEAEPKGTSYEVKDMSRMSRDGSGRRMNGSLLIISLAHLSPAHLLGSVVSSLRSSSNRTERREPDERRRASLTGRKVRRPQTAEEVTDGGRERDRSLPLRGAMEWSETRKRRKRDRGTRNGNIARHSFTRSARVSMSDAV